MNSLPNFRRRIPLSEAKIYQTIELLKTAREGKAAAERDVTRLREQLELREEETESLRKEMIGLPRSAKRYVPE